VTVSLLAAVPPALLMLAGFVLCFFGYKLLRVTLALCGFGAGLLLGLTIARLIPHANQVFTLVLGVVCGILGAVLATVLYKVGVFLVGVVAGVLVATVIVTATGWHFPMIGRVIGAIVGGILCLLLERPLVSVLSAFTGAWGLAFGTFRLFGWYHIIASARRPPANYGLMVACWLILGLIGAGVQLRSGKKPKVKE